MARHIYNIILNIKICQADEHNINLYFFFAVIIKTSYFKIWQQLYVVKKSQYLKKKKQEKKCKKIYK